MENPNHERDLQLHNFGSRLKKNKIGKTTMKETYFSRVLKYQSKETHE